MGSMCGGDMFNNSRYYCQAPLHISQYSWYFVPSSICLICCRIAYSFASTINFLVSSFPFLANSQFSIFLLLVQNRATPRKKRKITSKIHKVRFFILITITSVITSSEFPFHSYITNNFIASIIMSNSFTNQSSTFSFYFTRNARIMTIF